MNIFLNTAIIVQARTGSTRLPNKMVLPFFNEEGVLEIILKRLKKKYSKKFKIILATTTNINDDIIVKIGERSGITVFRGSEKDVLSRFIQAAEIHKIQNIVRVCADNPLLDINHIKELIDIGIKENLDYLSYQCLDKTPVIKSHLGLFTEFTTINTLKKVNQLTSKDFYHEHVTNFIYENNKIFNNRFIKISKELENKKDYRFTLDTLDDFTLLQKIYSEIGESNLTIQNIVNYIEINTNFKKHMIMQIKNNTK